MITVTSKKKENKTNSTATVQSHSWVRVLPTQIRGGPLFFEEAGVWAITKRHSCTCVRYWPDRGLVFECVTCFYFFSFFFFFSENCQINCGRGAMRKKIEQMLSSLQVLFLQKIIAQAVGQKIALVPPSRPHFSKKLKVQRVNRNMVLASLATIEVPSNNLNFPN